MHNTILIKIYEVVSEVLLKSSIFVTRFGKTIPVCTRIEIYFIAYCNSRTQALSRHSDTIAID